MIGLDWSAIDFEKKAITIRQAAANTESGEIIKGPKTESGYRSLILPEECFTVLKEWKQEQAAIKGELGSRWQGAADEEKQPVFIQENGRRMNLYTPGQAFDRILHFYNEDIQRQIEEVQNNMTVVSQVSDLILGSMDEMAAGSQQINSSSQSVSDLARNTRDNIQVMDALLRQFTA